MPARAEGFFTSLWDASYSTMRAARSSNKGGAQNLCKPRPRVAFESGGSLVAGFLADSIWQIHSLRASGA